MIDEACTAGVSHPLDWLWVLGVEGEWRGLLRWQAEGRIHTYLPVLVNMIVMFKMELTVFQTLSSHHLPCNCSASRG